jgi:hypothetical protein
VAPRPVAERGEYLASLDDQRRDQIAELDELIRRLAPDLETGFDRGMLTYGPYHYIYPTGNEGDSAWISLSSRKRYISLYVICSDGEQYLAETFRDRLPNADIGKSCVRFRRLEDIDLDVISELVTQAARQYQPLLDLRGTR